MPGQCRVNAILTINRHWPVRLVGAGPAHRRTGREPHASSGARETVNDLVMDAQLPPERVNSRRKLPTCKPRNRSVRRTGAKTRERQTEFDEFA
jgi:hypothetical protein